MFPAVVVYHTEEYHASRLVHHLKFKNERAMRTKPGCNLSCHGGETSIASDCGICD